MIARSKELDKIALAMLEDGSKLLLIAAKVAQATGCPIVGGVAVFLHGYRRTTVDVDIFTDDTNAARAAITSIGATWNEADAEGMLDGIPIHFVTTSITGSKPTATININGVQTVSLADLIRFKLTSGLAKLERARDLADVVELVRRVPLDKSFAAKLPSELRKPFKEIVDAVHP